MAVAIARTSVLALAGSTAGRTVLGAFPGGLWVPTLSLSLNSSAAGAITLSPSLVRTDDTSAASHLNGRAIIDRGEVLLNGKPAVTIDIVEDTILDLVLPVGLLPGSGPWWMMLAAVHSNGLATSRVIMSAIALPFEGAAGSRRAGDGRAPAGAGFGGAPGGRGGVGGGGAGGIR